jgi:hypothetical protein
MRKIQLLLFITISCCATQLSAQHISLVENKGEIGLMGGASFYRGDIASDIFFYKPNVGVFYKKQLNDYVGVRLNYEYISLGANDLQSNNFYDYKRGLNFTRVSHDVSVMGEFYFLKFINGNKQYRFTPYVGFGIGAWKSISGSTNIDTPKTQRTILFPLNLGFKYNVGGSWNIFTEVTYRFTNSDKIDYFSDINYHIPKGSATIFQASTSGYDQYFSTKLGVSYNLLTVYGLNPRKDPRKRDNLFSRPDKNQGGKSFFSRFFSLFKRK